MKIFNDYYNNQVKLSFFDQPFELHPKHVWVICRYQSKWLLTRHLERGLEFPGGKVEKDESAKAAAIREVKEETGGEIESIQYIGQYFVTGRKDQLAKNIYFAEIKSLKKQSTYMETAGPVLLEKLPENIRINESFSFIMKDDVLTHSLEIINEHFVNS
ncbi:nucleoside triphosphatase YtkD [Gracilibacillus oryzae]|uniref:Nucleoside triphosphatase YtkD n=1 Tax=Gracilibacillus oryzae TaxID=1672701 RepID=A0A7C8GSH7_9BACI|nr:nucleoside triphosphatase YtkD [Gracilibacillus oryzae]KAB8131477.1 nucleoside triphosphatase YtkD [Gracilibacillus oryzae]